MIIDGTEGSVPMTCKTPGITASPAMWYYKTTNH